MGFSIDDSKEGKIKVEEGLQKIYGEIEKELSKVMTFNDTNRLLLRSLALHESCIVAAQAGAVNDVVAMLRGGIVGLIDVMKTIGEKDGI